MVTGEPDIGNLGWFHCMGGLADWAVGRKCDLGQDF